MMDFLASREAEQALIYHALSLFNSEKEILDRVSPSAFYNGIHSEIWRIARELRGDGKRVTPTSVIAASGMGDSSGFAREVTAATETPVPGTVVVDAEVTVRDLANRRELLQAIESARQGVLHSDTYDEGLYFAQGALDGLSGVSVPDEVVSFADAVSRWQERMADGEDAHRVFATPWPRLNDVLNGGLQSGRSYVIGGRPGGGKSVGGANLVQHAAENGHVGVIFSVEMGANEVVSRALASGADAEYGQINRRQIDEFNYGRIRSYISQNRDMPLYIVDQANITIEKIASICRTIKRRNGLDVVFVDYLQLLDPSDTRVPRERQVAMISRALKVLSRDLDCAVVTACQLNRNSSNEQRPPRLSDLRESGAIEQDADVVMLLNNFDAADPRAGEIDLILEKNRTGKKQTVTQEWAGHKAAIR